MGRWACPHDPFGLLSEHLFVPRLLSITASPVVGPLPRLGLPLVLVVDERLDPIA